MKRILVTVISGALTLGASSAAFADDKIADRKEDQQDRIAQGIGNAKLSPREAGRLENQEAELEPGDPQGPKAERRQSHQQTKSPN